MNSHWTEKTWRSGGHDRQDFRCYRYHFEDQWFRWLNRYQGEITLPFTTTEPHLFGDTRGHHAVLRDPDFSVKGRNVMDWARECVTRGKADFLFTLDRGDGWAFPRPETQFILRARFSDKGLATLFKLSFGGR